MSRYVIQKERKLTQAHKQEGQKKNRSGAYSFKLDDWGRLMRFLILGVESSTYYASRNKLVKMNSKLIEKLLKEDGVRVVETVLSVIGNNRAPRPAPSLFTLAVALKKGDMRTKRLAEQHFNEIVRTSPQLFSVVEDIKRLGGFSRLTRRVISNWYLNKSVKNLGYQLVKYQSRKLPSGKKWSHRDVLRLAHPNATTAEIDNLFGYVTQGHVNSQLPPQVLAFESLKADDVTPNEVVQGIESQRLTWEMIPTQFLKSMDVWSALLDEMPMTAMIRNLARMTSNDLLKANSREVGLVCERLADVERLQKARIHPLAILVALNTYSKGTGHKGNLTWRPVQRIVDALDEAFYLTFENVKTTNKRWMLALDVSASMTWNEIAGMTGVTPRIGSACMAMVTAHREPNHLITAFSGGRGGWGSTGSLDGITEVKLGKRNSLEEVQRKIAGMRASSTDCSLPMRYATHHGLEVDMFVIYTDNETNHYGELLPHLALQQYRQTMGIDAKLVVVGMTADKFTIADPNDTGMMDVVGFDTSAPSLMSRFALGEL